MSTVGTYKIEDPGCVSKLRLNFSRISMVANWRKCSAMADFLAEFIAEDLDDPESASLALSEVMNELVENAVKFSKPGPTEVSIELPFWGDRLVVVTRHACTTPQSEAFARWVERLERSDPEALFLEQLEFTATHTPDESGLGLITLIKDHNAKVGLQTHAFEDGMKIDFQVHLPLDHLLSG